MKRVIQTLALLMVTYCAAFDAAPLLRYCLSVGSSDVLDGMVAWWKFDETSGDIAHDSYGSCDAVMTDGAVFSSGAGAFPNDSSAAVTAYTNVIGTSDFTFMAWIYTTTEQKAGIMSKRSDLEGYVQANLTINTYNGATSETPGNRVSFFLYYPMVEVSTTSSVVNVGWTHVCGVRNGTNHYIYVNGRKENTSYSESTVSLPISAALMLGNLGTTLGTPIQYSFEGLIRGARVYTRALSDEEVLAACNATAN